MRTSKTAALLSRRPLNSKYVRTVAEGAGTAQGWLIVMDSFDCCSCLQIWKSPLWWWGGVWLEGRVTDVLC